jgi:Ycf66 protein N-terminus
MINSSFGLGSILGIILVLAGVGLYLLRTMRPTLARDQDIFFAAIAQHQGHVPPRNVPRHERKPL